MTQLGLEAYLVLVALLIGSFINLAADRLPRGESVVSPRSHCRSCGRVLNVVDLFPVAGYLVRRRPLRKLWRPDRRLFTGD